jgi:ATP-dependent helicase/nuclease subunit A
MLVAAAAGSGKTAVLVERIIRRIADETEPLDVDRLLVATFTNAAAAEMRERIRHALENALAERPDSRHLRAQLALLPRASITTIHSFCLEVIRRHYRVIALDPGFRIANQTEAELIKQEILEQLIDDYYGAAGEADAFWLLVDGYGGGRGDEELFRLILSLYEFSRSHPAPAFWLQQMADQIEAGGDPAGLEFWFASLREDVRLELAGIRGLLAAAVQLAGEPGGPSPYLDNLLAEQAAAEMMFHQVSSDWEGLYALFQLPVFGRLKPCRGDEYDKDIQKKTTELRDMAKKKLTRLKSELFMRTPDMFAEELAQLAPAIRVLVELVTVFADRFGTEKRQRGLVDFADLEHYTLAILSGGAAEDGSYRPGAAAAEYREQYEEILLDEYQDTNRVQETIISLIARHDVGNRFMVGDVKQSIYRFRLAEPGLFLEKYKSYRLADAVQSENASGQLGSASRHTEGRRIDLARNFRSRSEVVAGVNELFRQIMEESVGEISYDRRAELVNGATYPALSADYRIEVNLIDKSAGVPEQEAQGNVEQEHPRVWAKAADDNSAIEGSGEEEGEQELADERLEAETARLEARYIAARIKELTGATGGQAFPVTGKGDVPPRPIAFRDIVILLRATQSWAPVFAEELKLQGIPIYAEVNTGYFAAVEIEVMLSLLKVIDNPYQDIPLASVLYSPIVGLNAEEMAQIRAVKKAGAFYDAVLAYVEKETARELANAGASSNDDLRPPALTAGLTVAVEDIPLKDKLIAFIAKLETWRVEAGKQPVADLIHLLFRDTGYYDFVGGLPGGLLRQANLRALHDRARQYEATSFRGVFRFLRFLGRMRDSGGDLGTAKALGEQEDVVRLMTIHKSKGLEFPVVFVAGLSKPFNRQDLYGSFLIHKDLGFGPKFIDTVLRLSYPTLPSLAIRKRQRLEMLAEELRVLYVAMTRAREKLILVGTVKNGAKAAATWERSASAAGRTLPNYELAGASCYLDWIGPALFRHPDGGALRQAAQGSGAMHGLAALDADLLLPADGQHKPLNQEMAADDRSQWQIGWVTAGELSTPASVDLADIVLDAARVAALRGLQPVQSDSGLATEVERKLSWQYPYPQASGIITKTTVSELKRLSERDGAQGDALDERTEEAPRQVPGAPESPKRSTVFRRPRFLESRKLNAAERGTVYHAVLQRLPLTPSLTEQVVADTLADMVDRQLLLPEQAREVNVSQLFAFFTTELGQRLLFASWQDREIPFSYKLAAQEIYQGLTGETGEETVLVQGIIDCLFEDAEGLILLDYKTDQLNGTTAAERASHYQRQLALYVRAVKAIWGRSPVGVYLYFMDSGEFVPWSPEETA